MALPAQYLPNGNRVVNNGLNDFQQLQQYRENLGGGLFGGYINYGGQPILNGGVISGLESELTCNVTGSRKRNRDEHVVLTQNQNQNQQKFQIENLSTVQYLERSTINSTALHLSKAENRLKESQTTSTSGRSAATVSLPSSYLVTEPLTQDLSSYLFHNNLEMDALIRFQNEKLRLVMEETRKRHCRSLLSALEQEVVKRLKEKEMEMEKVKRKNEELEEKVKQMKAESRIWFNAVKNSESIVLGLRSNIEQVLVQNTGLTKEGFGESDRLADDAESCCYEDKIIVTERTLRDNRKVKDRKTCKVCLENDVSVLLLPCRHLCLCKDCESKLDSCPICKCRKNASLQIFMT